MSNLTSPSLRGVCPPPFFQQDKFPSAGGMIEGRVCQPLGTTTCCLPCPMTDWVYPDNFSQLTSVANWLTVVGMLCCIFLMFSWAFLPVEKTARHYLSISLTAAVMFLNLGFIIPLAGRPDQCYNQITPNNMYTSSICAASGSVLLFGGWSGVMWVFLRSVSLHLQICWQVVVGRNFMWASQVLGWGVPVIGLTVLLTLSGVSFRFGSTCHINHTNSLGDFWIPLLVFSGLTVILQFATFGYCIKVYLASLADNGHTTENSELPAYSNSIRTMTPRQAYRRVRRVIQLQWRGIVIVLIIICDVILFTVVFVLLDNTVESIKNNPAKAQPWVLCLFAAQGDKNKCLDKAGPLVVALPTVMAVLILLATNGFWVLLLLGRWSMVTGWLEFFGALGGTRAKKEFVSVDARNDYKKEPRSYEMLSRDSAKTESVLTPVSPTKNETNARSGRRTPDYFQAPGYQPHARSFSSPRPPQQPTAAWPQQQAPADVAGATYNAAQQPATYTTQPGPVWTGGQQSSNYWATEDVQAAQTRQGRTQAPPQAQHQRDFANGYEGMNPLGMNRI